MMTGIRPFSDGSQYADWRAMNCAHCALYDQDHYTGRCEIDGALGLADVGDGTVPAEIARRMGYVPGHLFWRCPESQPVKEEVRR